MSDTLSSALRDGLKHHELWVYLSVQDIRLRYRRSKIGPFWITLSMAIFCLSLGLVYSKLFKSNLADYLPFLSVGFIFWWLISGMLAEFPNAFVDQASYIKDVKIAPMTILLRIVARHMIIFAHNAIIIVAIFFYFRVVPSWTVLLALPGLFLVLLNMQALGVILSLVGARFRDVAPITQAMIQVIFFITPLTWFPKLLPKDSLFVIANPFAYYIDITRSPLLGQMPAGSSWLLSLVTLLLFSVIGAVLYRAKSMRIPFWV